MLIIYVIVMHLKNINKIQKPKTISTKCECIKVYYLFFNSITFLTLYVTFNDRVCFSLFYLLISVDINLFFFLATDIMLSFFFLNKYLCSCLMLLHVND